ncbi:hypothetical protein CEP51_011822 [Fusarium floridanum]|uniref:Uncharacterized protein n=1 Tax=Fusarium floridanum TaxID=1325733 RepID=A0A428R617_9HYPO|nr:hypothetical protein CEP51_011822 [Fusarium floridanum]
MNDQSEPPTKKRRTEAPVKEGPIQLKEDDPILSKGEEPIPLKDEEEELEELFLLLMRIHKLTRRNQELKQVLDETLAETSKLRTRLDYLRVVQYLKAENPMFRPISILISPRKRPPVRKAKSPKKRAKESSG